MNPVELNADGDVQPVTIEITLISHTNAGKTTLARTLLARDIGEVRDAPHVTEEAEAHTLVESPAGDVLRLWDTPGFGDTPRLLQRLRIADNPIGWLLREVWDRYRDRPLWCTQQAIRVARDATDVVLYLVNAAEDPRDAGYVAPEMQVLRWVGKPIIVLLNQVGPPRSPADEQADIDRWRAHLIPSEQVGDVLALDAFARCWVQEGVLLDAVGRQLSAEKRDGFRRLNASWQQRNIERFEASMRVMAAALADAARDHEPAAALPAAQRMLLAIGVGRDRQDAVGDAAMARLAERLDASTRAVTARLIELHDLHGDAVQIVLQRLRSQFSSDQRVDEGKAALWGGIVTGALTGLKADLAAGGLTFGAGLLVGGVIGGLTGAGVARGVNRLSGGETPQMRWSDGALTGLVRASVLRYLAVAHFGRGRGRYVQGEAPPHWQPLVDAQVQLRVDRFNDAWSQVRADSRTAPPANAPGASAATSSSAATAPRAATAGASSAASVSSDPTPLTALMIETTAAVLNELYPGRVPGQLARR